jgi:large subunit ribosomal protein L32
MAVPKKRTSKSVRNMRRAHDFLVQNTAVDFQCSNCGALKIRHRVCPACGFYRGKKVIEVRA